MAGNVLTASVDSLARKPLFLFPLWSARLVIYPEAVYHVLEPYVPGAFHVQFARREYVAY